MSTITPVEEVPDSSKLPALERRDLRYARGTWLAYRRETTKFRAHFIWLIRQEAQRGYSDQAIADALGLSRTYIQKLRSGGKR